MTEKTFIDQTNNYRVDGFGNVLRSSGIFFYRKTDTFRTTVTFMNYWKLKRSLDVTVIASLRDMDGTLLRREELSFDNGVVQNYSPNTPYLPFEGSVEIEVFALKNMVIPFAAIIVVYETEESIGLVHNYARTYSIHEIEEGRTISNGEESCWTLRDEGDVRSFAVFHNGVDPQPGQKAQFRATRFDGATRDVEVDLPELKSFETYKFRPADHDPGLIEFLDGRPGNGALSYRLNKAFTRMLIGNENLDGQDFQVTHSNFNYSKHQTNSVTGEDAAAIMMMPDGSIPGRRLRVYPDNDVADYRMNDASGADTAFKTGDIIDQESPAGEIAFYRDSGGIPSRLVTAIVGETKPGKIPFELSLGIMHKDRPPKRLWWMPVANDGDRDGTLVMSTYDSLYGAYEGQDISVRLYSESADEPLEAVLSGDMVEKSRTGLRIAEIFPDSEAFLDGGLGWITWYSEYGGFQVFTQLERRGGSSAMEHGF